MGGRGFNDTVFSGLPAGMVVGGDSSRGVSAAGGEVIDEGS